MGVISLVGGTRLLGATIAAVDSVSDQRQKSAAAIRVRIQDQRQPPPAGGETAGHADGRRIDLRSYIWMEQPPSHRANLVEEKQGGGCLSAMHGTGEAENP